MTATSTDIDPRDLLEFIEAPSIMSKEAMVERWPEWTAQYLAAVERYRKESQGSRLRIAKSNPMVGSTTDAVRQWVHLPLIRACLAKQAA